MVAQMEARQHAHVRGTRCASRTPINPASKPGDRVWRAGVVDDGVITCQLCDKMVIGSLVPVTELQVWHRKPGLNMES